MTEWNNMQISGVTFTLQQLYNKIKEYYTSLVQIGRKITVHLNASYIPHPKINQFSYIKGHFIPLRENLHYLSMNTILPSFKHWVYISIHTMFDYVHATEQNKRQKYKTSVETWRFLVKDICVSMQL